jgi:hypothetical protein
MIFGLSGSASAPEHINEQTVTIDINRLIIMHSPLAE